MITLIKSGEVFAPEYLGKKDILIAGGKIEFISEDIPVSYGSVPVRVLDAKGMLVFPGFIDSHVHILGGGGEGGFKTRTPEIQLSQLVSNGVTTVIGCLGTDGVCRDMKSLLAKARALEEEGITSYIYTGSYRIPLKTIMGSVQEDIMLIDKVIGIGEIAISDHRSSHPDFEEFTRIIADARVGGMLAGKAGIAVIHMGDGKAELDYLERLAEETEIPVTQVVPTHVTRNPSLFEKALVYAKKGGRVDLTTSTTKKFLEEGEVKCSKALKLMLERGVPLRNITFSSDGQGSIPRFDDAGECIGLGVGSVSSLFSEVKDAVLDEGISPDIAVRVITANVADLLKLHHKGYLREGMDGDVVVVDKTSFEIRHVTAKGQVMVQNGNVLVKGTFEV